MSNEIPNISHAGIVCSFAEDPTAPTIQAAWGLDEVAGFTRQVALGEGIYTIPLTRPVGALTGPNPGEIAEIGALITSSMFFSAGNTFDVSLQSSQFLGGVPPVNTRINLDLLLFILIATGVASDIAMVCQAEVRRVPTQD